MRLIVNFLIISFLLILAILGGVHFTLPKHEVKFQSKVWKHRGGNPENTLQGIEASLQEGYEGLEIDVHFYNNKVLIGHTLSEAQKNLIDLNKVILGLNGKRASLWLDFKKQSFENSYHFSFYLRKLLKNYANPPQLFVETKDPITLAFLSLARIPTSFWYEPPPSIPRGLYKTLFKVLTWYFKPHFLSSQIENYSSLEAMLPRNEKLIFTLNDLELIKSYCRTPNIKIILTDFPYERIQSACE